MGIFNNPYNIAPTYDTVSPVILQLAKIYSRIPETTCCGSGICCKTGCPHMYYSEFLNLWLAVEEMGGNYRAEIIFRALKNYMDESVVKPCPVYSEGNDNRLRGCLCYEKRPYNCRFYGIIPSSEYEKRVNGFEKTFGRKAMKKNPLRTQCSDVEIKDGILVSEGYIDDIADDIEAIDVELGIRQMLVKSKQTSRTLHDFIMLTYFGESKMVDLTEIRVNSSDNAKKDFLEEMKKQLGIQDLEYEYKFDIRRGQSSYSERDELSLIKCYVCGKRNQKEKVQTGVCGHCGFDANQSMEVPKIHGRSSQGYS